MLVTKYLTSFPSVFTRALVFSSCTMLFEDPQITAGDAGRRYSRIIAEEEDSEQLE
jgi:hypothetical protein